MGCRRCVLPCFGHYDADEEAAEQNAQGPRPVEDLPLATTSLHAFTVDELKSVTRNYSSTNYLGEGGCGPVYKGSIGGTLHPGLVPQQVAVKYLYLDRDGVQGHREWLAEVKYLELGGMLRHPHLVKLLGFCNQDDHRVLVYEYMPSGSLENNLFWNVNGLLPWSTRLKIAVDAAKGLAFLHEADMPVIYGDFKASNILLDLGWDCTAKLSNFGLANEWPKGDDTHVTTPVMATHGYAAPEYIVTGHLTAKSDVYSFGVMLLELLTGRRSIDKRRIGREQDLVDWARPHLRRGDDGLDRIMDPCMKSRYSRHAALGVAAVADDCLQFMPNARPRMRKVVEALEPLLAHAKSRRGARAPARAMIGAGNERHQRRRAGGHTGLVAREVGHARPEPNGTPLPMKL